jgi:hypothetical protein
MPISHSHFDDICFLPQTIIRRDATGTPAWRWLCVHEGAGHSRTQAAPCSSHQKPLFYMRLCAPPMEVGRRECRLGRGDCHVKSHREMWRADKYHLITAEDWATAVSRHDDTCRYVIRISTIYVFCLKRSSVVTRRAPPAWRWLCVHEGAEHSRTQAAPCRRSVRAIVRSLAEHPCGDNECVVN